MSAALTELGVDHSIGGTTPCGLFACDLVVPPAGNALPPLILDVDPPSAFASGSRRPLGRTAARRAAVEAVGYPLRCVPYYEWDGVAAGAAAADGDSAAREARREYVASLLASVPGLLDGDDGDDDDDDTSWPVPSRPLDASVAPFMPGALDPDDGGGLAAAVAGVAVSGDDGGGNDDGSR